jgi:hypothetical protein
MEEIEMNLIDRYISEMMTRIPESNREDVQNKLRTRIDSLLPENASENDIRTVLEQLGNPMILAAEYRSTKKYLIGPEIYDRYLYVLKIVMMIVPIIAAMVALIEGIIELPLESGLFQSLTDTFANMLESAIDGAAQAFLWVTLVFVIIERNGVSKEVLPKLTKHWSVDEWASTKPVSNKSRISRVEMVFAIFFTVVFAALIYFKPELIGIYSFKDGHLNLKETLFVLERLSDYMSAIILLALVQFCVLIAKFIKMRWTLTIAFANAGYNIGISILYSLMAVDKSLFNKGFISQIADLANMSISQSEWLRFTGAVAIVFVIGCTIDSIVGFFKSRK